jgi:hypothetical protein
LHLPLDFPVWVFDTVIYTWELILSWYFNTATLTGAWDFIVRSWLRGRDLSFSLFLIDWLLNDGVHVITFFARCEFLTMAHWETLFFKLFRVTWFFDGLCLSLK